MTERWSARPVFWAGPLQAEDRLPGAVDGNGLDRLVDTRARPSMQSYIGEIQAEIRDGCEQLQANTKAVLRLLDRFGPADAPS